VGGDDAAALSLIWKERGVPARAESVSTGFGRELIERALSVTLRAEASWILEADGVRCCIRLPLGNRARPR
jgi:two-component system CheB/CheR fusion protein